MKIPLSIALLLTAAAALAQIPAQKPVQSRPGQPAPSLTTQTTVVLVPALVRSADGEIVFTLQAGDFRVTDDGIEQPLTLDEDTGSEPIALVIAVQTGGAGAGKLKAYRDLNAVVSSIVGSVPHRIAVLGFDSTPEVLQPFTADADAAANAFQDLDAGDKGAAILDALAFSVNLLRTQPPSYRRAILLISETLDHGSQTTLDDALRAVSDTNTAIYSLGFSSSKADAAHYADRELPFHKDANGVTLANAHPGPPHGCMGEDPDPDATKNKANQAFDCLGLLAPPLALAKMAAIATADSLERNVPETVAQLTGGEYFKFEDQKTLVRDLVTISNHIPNRYVLSFHPTAPHPGFHAVELKLRDYPALHVTARSGYWADEPVTTP
jgi:VWFA-related protein